MERKPETKGQGNDDDDNSETPSTSGVTKKFRLGSKTKEATNNDIPSEDWNNHVTEIQKEWEKVCCSLTHPS